MLIVNRYILCYFYEKEKCNIYIYGSYFYLWIRTKMYIGSEFKPLENMCNLNEYKFVILAKPFQMNINML